MADAAPPGAERRSAEDRLLEAAGLSVEKLPVLRTVFERMRAGATQALQHLSPSPLGLELGEIVTGRIGDLLDAAEGSAVAVVFHSSEWDARILVGLDRACLYTMLEAVLGADGSEPPGGPEARPFTALEKRLARAVAEHAAQALGRGFTAVSATSFAFERTETRMELAAIGRRDDGCVVARLRLRALEREGELCVLIPERALQPLRYALARPAQGPGAEGDPHWSRQMRQEVQRARVTLRAVLEERQLTLGEIAGLKVGQRLELQATPRSRVRVECNEQALFWCALGQADGAYTLRIEDFVDREQEFLDGILPG